MQQAVDAAADGDPVLVRAGAYTRSEYTESEYTDSNGKTYKHRFFLDLRDKAITLTGENNVIFDGENSSEMSGIANWVQSLQR